MLAELLFQLVLSERSNIFVLVLFELVGDAVFDEHLQMRQPFITKKINQIVLGDVSREIDDDLLLVGAD